MRIDSLREDLTLEDFKILASRQPLLEGEWVYRYEAIGMADESEMPYPEFDVWVLNRMLFRSFEDAATYMHKLCEEADEPDTYYCHTITQIPIGQEESEHGARWLFGPDGSLIDYSIASWTGDPEHYHFFGHPKERIRFKKGDIVEVWNQNGVRLMPIVAPEPTVEDCWEIYQRCKEISKEDHSRFYYSQDPSDDMCIVISGPGYEYHEHVSPLHIMKPRFPIPDFLRDEMLGWLNELDKQTLNNNEAK